MEGALLPEGAAVGIKVGKPVGLGVVGCAVGIELGQ